MSTVKTKNPRSNAYGKISMKVSNRTIENVYLVQAEYNLEFVQAVELAISVMATHIRVKNNLPTKLKLKQQQQQIEKNTPASIAAIVAKGFGL